VWPSRRVVVAALALGTAPLVAQAMAEERSDPWRSVARYDLEYRVRLEVGSAPDRVALWVPYPAETRDQRVLDYPYAEAQGRPVEPPRADIRFRRLASREPASADGVAR
jgi:hypothetical protein